MISLVIAAWAVVSGAEGSRSGEVRLEPGRVEVVIASSAGDVTRYAADELAGHLAKSLGSVIPVRSEPAGDGTVSLIVGTNAWSRAAGVFPETLPRDGFFIRSVPGRVYIAGCDSPRPGCMAGLLRAKSMWPFQHVERASVFAVYGFLERFAGVRFYFPGEFGTVVPRRKSLAVPFGTWRRSPDFTVREPSFTDPETYLRLGAQSRYTPCGHGLRGVMSIERFGRSHPEYFVLTKGPDGKKVREPALGKRLDRRHSGHLCYSNPAVAEQIYTDALAYFSGVGAEEHGVPCIFDWGAKWSWNHGCWYGEYFDLMGQDGFKPCLCDACQAAYDKSDSQYATELVWGVTAAVAQRFLDEGRPGVFTQMAYPPYRAVPKCDIPTNVLVMVSRYGPWASGNATLLERDVETVKAWAAKLGRKVWMWTYPGKLGSLNLTDVPQMSPRAHGTYFKTLSPYIFGMKTESETDRKIYNYLNDYVAQRVAWDVTTDVDAVLAEHHRVMFGAAAGEMAEFYALLERKWVGEIAGNVAETPVGPVVSAPSVQDIWMRVYSPSFIADCEKLFEKAAAKLVSGSPEAARLAFIRREFLEPLAAKSRRLAAGFEVAAELERRKADSRKPNLLGGDGEALWHPWPGTNMTAVADRFVTPPSSRRVVSHTRTYVTRLLRGMLETNTTYRVSLFARGENIVPFSTYDGGLNVEITDGTRKWRYPYANGNNGVGFFGTFDWIHLDFKFKTGPKIGKNPYLAVRLANCTGTAWFDAPRLERVDPEPPGADSGTP